MSWCERQGIDYVLGMAKNPRLLKEIEADKKAAEAEFVKNKEAVRIFKNFRYRTLEETWSRSRRVVAKAEHLEKGSNPRFIVTSPPQHQFAAPVIYETIYCAREDMENRIKEQQMGLFADRLSSESIRGNQFRLYCSSIAYILMHAAAVGFKRHRAGKRTMHDDSIEGAENRCANRSHSPSCLVPLCCRISVQANLRTSIQESSSHSVALLMP